VVKFMEVTQDLPGGTEKTHENLRQDSRSLARDLNLGPRNMKQD
jgi:hypothetical protein